MLSFLTLQSLHIIENTWLHILPTKPKARQEELKAWMNVHHLHSIKRRWGKRQKLVPLFLFLSFNTKRRNSPYVKSWITRKWLFEPHHKQFIKAQNQTGNPNPCQLTKATKCTKTRNQCEWASREDTHNHIFLRCKIPDKLITHRLKYALCLCK